MSFVRFSSTNSLFGPKMLINSATLPRLLTISRFNSSNLPTIKDARGYFKMGIMFPVMLASGIGITHRYFSRELDEIFGEFNQPIFGFTGGMSVGIVIGLLLGVNYYEFFSGTFAAMKNIFMWLIGEDVTEHPDKDKKA